jgi:hypothetical protein
MDSENEEIMARMEAIRKELDIINNPEWLNIIGLPQAVIDEYFRSRLK